MGGKPLGVCQNVTFPSVWASLMCVLVQAFGASQTPAFGASSSAFGASAFGVSGPNPPLHTVGSNAPTSAWTQVPSQSKKY